MNRAPSESISTGDIEVSHFGGWALQVSIRQALFYVAAINDYSPDKIKLIPFDSISGKWHTHFKTGDVFSFGERHFKVVKMDIGNSPHMLLEATAIPADEWQISMFQE